MGFRRSWGRTSKAAQTFCFVNKKHAHTRAHVRYHMQGKDNVQLEDGPHRRFLKARSWSAQDRTRGHTDEGRHHWHESLEWEALGAADHPGKGDRVRAAGAARCTPALTLT